MMIFVKCVMTSAFRRGLVWVSTGVLMLLTG